jgi:hypothetical protein
MASAAPAGHSAPMPIPSRMRNTARNMMVGEKPAMKLQIEYQRMEIISGARRPMRSPSQPAAVAPSRRIHSVKVAMKATSVTEMLNSAAIGLRMKKKIVKSNASSVQPSQAAMYAYHWSLVGSLYQGTGAEVLDADIG